MPFWKRASKTAAHPDTLKDTDDQDEPQAEQPQEETKAGDPNSWHAEAVESLRPKPVWADAVLCRGAMLGSPAIQPMAAPSGRRAFGAPGTLQALKCSAPRAMCAAPQMAPMACAAAAPAGAGIGFKTGGAQDVGNFRENLAAGKLPQPSDVTFEGLCKDYYFDTNSSDVPPVTELFAPTYSLALAPDPLLAAGDSTATCGGAAGAGGSPAVPAAEAAAGRAPQQAERAPQQAERAPQQAERAPQQAERAPQQAEHAPQQAELAPQQAHQAQQDVFLAVGLDSGLTDFKRPRLNLAILLDVSGSMDSRFDEYYYDPGSGERRRLADGEARQTKLDVAKEVMKGMLERLAPDDMVSISLFSDRTSTPKLLGRWGEADAAGIKAGIDALQTVGCTNFQAGLDEAAEQLRRAPAVVDSDPSTTENRIVVLTDAQPNAGEISETGLLSRLKASAADRIYCTLVGVGLDFDSELVEKVLKCRGANYLSVHTPGEFKRRLDDEFDFMVAPLVFDLELRVDPASLAAPTDGGPGASASTTTSSGSAAAAGWRVVHVYGSPDSEERRLSGGGSIMRVHTLFPSPKTEEGIKGGVVLLRLAPPAGTAVAAAPPLRLEARYQDRSGQQYSTLRAVAVPAEAADVAASEAEGPTALYQSTGVRKAVLLARLTDALQGWLVDEWRAASQEGTPGPNSWNAAMVQELLGEGARPPAPQPAPQPRDPQQAAAPAPLYLRPGCPLLPLGQEALDCCKSPAGRHFSPWERQSRPLAVNPEARAAFRQLLPWVESEVAALGDAGLEQEVALLRKLAGAS